MAPQVGFKPHPEIPTSETIVLKIVSEKDVAAHTKSVAELERAIQKTLPYRITEGLPVNRERSVCLPRKCEELCRLYVGVIARHGYASPLALHLGAFTRRVWFPQ